MTKSRFRVLGFVASLVVGGAWIFLAPVANAQQNTCAADLNNDGEVNSTDLSMLILAFDICSDPTNCPEDLDSSGIIDSGDMGLLLLRFGQCEVLPSLTGHVTYSDGTVANAVTVTATPTTNGNAQTVAQTDPSPIQTMSKSFSNGYRYGFKKAYPLGMCPIPPIEKNTYGDGYGMGYSAGMSAKPR